MLQINKFSSTVKILLVLALSVSSAVVSSEEGLARRNQTGGLKEWDWKKNVFISRGWGASGMPLQNDTIKKLRYPWQTYFRDKFNEVGRRQGANYTIPHLFVSYGWGPLG